MDQQLDAGWKEQTIGEEKVAIISTKHILCVYMLADINIVRII